MYWIALQPTHEDERSAWSWWALQFTPRVALLEEALLLEVQASERLWGGRRSLLHKLLETGEALTRPIGATGASALIALALLRLKQRGDKTPANVPDGLPLDVLSAAQPHLRTLERIGCRTWGQLRALPRAGVSRRFGVGLLQALDCAYGQRPERYDWLTLPESFDLKLELPALASSAPELMWIGQRLLSQLQVWLQARNRGVLALELEWTLALRRFNGKLLPPTEKIEVRTAQPTQDMAHLRKLVSEHLARTSLAAPANHLRLRSLETVPWSGATTSLLPEDQRKGEELHQFIERLSVRLGEDHVLIAQAQEDHRPERMQRWLPARGGSAQLAGGAPIRPSSSGGGPNTRSAFKVGLREPSPSEGGQGGGKTDALYPAWLLPHPQRLEMRGDVPCYGGPLRRLARLYRVETGWWEEGGPALRDYFIARSEQAGLVWIFRERPLQLAQGLEHAKQFRWYLHGLYS